MKARNRRKSKFFVKKIADFKALAFGPLELRFLTGDGSFGGTSVLHEILPAGSSVPDLYHRKTDELVIVLKGRLRATVNKKRFWLGAGHVLHLPAGTRHQFSTGKKSAEAVSLFSPPMTMDNLDVVKVSE